MTRLFDLSAIASLTGVRPAMPLSMYP